MRFKKLISAFLAAAFCVSLAGMAFAEKLTKVPTAWMDEHETFLIWYAKEKGWDKEAGLDIDRKSTRLNSSHPSRSRMPSSA